jgi:hypothetical protein
MSKQFSLNQVYLTRPNKAGNWISIDVENPANNEFLNEQYMISLDKWVKENNVRAQRMSFSMWKCDSQKDLSAFIFFVGKFNGQ